MNTQHKLNKIQGRLRRLRRCESKSVLSKFQASRLRELEEMLKPAANKP